MPVKGIIIKIYTAVKPYTLRKIRHIGSGSGGYIQNAQVGKGSTVIVNAYMIQYAIWVKGYSAGVLVIRIITYYVYSACRRINSCQKRIIPGIGITITVNITVGINRNIIKVVDICS